MKLIKMNNTIKEILAEEFNADTVLNQLKYNNDNIDEKNIKKLKEAITSFIQRIRSYNPAVMRKAVAKACFRGGEKINELLGEFENPDAYITYFKFDKKRLDNNEEKINKYNDLINKFDTNFIYPHEFEIQMNNLFSSKHVERKVKNDEVKWIKTIDKDGWEILQPLTYGAAVKYSKTKEGKTLWCTAADIEMYDNYSKTGTLTIIRNYNKGKAYQFYRPIEGSVQFMNKNDVRMTYPDMKELYSSIPEEYLLKIFTRKEVNEDKFDLKNIASKIGNKQNRQNKNIKNGTRDNIIDSIVFNDFEGLEKILRKYFSNKGVNYLMDNCDFPFDSMRRQPDNFIKLGRGTVYVLNGNVIEDDDNYKPKYAIRIANRFFVKKRVFYEKPSSDGDKKMCWQEDNFNFERQKGKINYNDFKSSLGKVKVENYRYGKKIRIELKDNRYLYIISKKDSKGKTNNEYFFNDKLSGKDSEIHNFNQMRIIDKELWNKLIKDPDISQLLRNNNLRASVQVTI